MHHRAPAIPTSAQARSGVRLAAVTVLTLTALQVTVGGRAFAGDGAGSLPPWRRGISIWDGSGYRTRSPAPSDVSATPMGGRPARSGAAESPALRTTPVYRQPPYQVPSGGTSTSGFTPAATRGPSTPPTPATDGEVMLEPPISDEALRESENLPPPQTSSPPETLPVPEPSATETLAEQIEGGGIAETPPLEEDVVGWYQHAWQWLTEGWDNHAEFGLDGSDGNSDTLALQTGLELKRKTDVYTLALDADYRQVSNRRTTTEDNGRLNIDFDRHVGTSPWSMFGKLGLEWDAFKAFDLRLNLNSGVGYHWIRTDQTTFVTRFGAGASREFGAPVERWTPEAVFGIEAEHQLTKRQKLKARVDYFPAWDDFSDFRLVSDAAWEILLDNSENLSLKLALTDRYDSTPQGAEPNDVYYSLLLLYKF